MTQVTIANFQPSIFPTYETDISTERFSFEELFRHRGAVN